jgi:DNA-binding transcriptional regulator YiaG
MKDFPCPECGKGRMEEVIVPSYRTSIKGVPCIIPNARVFRCTNCQQISAAFEEMRRWEQCCDDNASATGVVPSYDRVRAIRATTGLSVSQFATLLGVTRQTVHAWERDSHGVKSFGPASILLLLLEAESCGRVTGVSALLRDCSVKRGVDLPRNQAIDPTAEVHTNFQSPLRHRSRRCPSFGDAFKDAA